MRTLLLCSALSLLTPVASLAWEFSPLPICTLSHVQDEITVELTYDASLPEYAIHLTRPSGWPPAAEFAITFVGPNGLTIRTGNHVIDGNTLTVRDRGFGNVLNGLQFNTIARATLGEISVDINIAQAADAVTTFRSCPADLSV